MTSLLTINGHLRSEFKKYQVGDQEAAQIVLRADVEFEGHKYVNIQILILEVLGYQEEGWYVADHYTSFLPILKPVKSFRKFLVKELRRIRDAEARSRSPNSPFWMGISQYICELERFDELRALIGQSRAVLDNLRHRLKDPCFPNSDRGRYSEALIRLIETHNKIPATKQHFVHKS